MVGLDPDLLDRSHFSLLHFQERQQLGLPLLELRAGDDRSIDDLALDQSLAETGDLWQTLPSLVVLRMLPRFAGFGNDLSHFVVLALQHFLVLLQLPLKAQVRQHVRLRPSNERYRILERPFVLLHQVGDH